MGCQVSAMLKMIDTVMKLSVLPHDFLRATLTDFIMTVSDFTCFPITPNKLPVHVSTSAVGLVGGDMIKYFRTLIKYQLLLESSLLLHINFLKN